MNRWQAQHEFWSSFGMPAYEENSVPVGAEFPYITYQSVSGGFSEILSVSASIWTRTTSWSTATAKADEIEKYIRSMGYPKIEGGRYRVYIGDSTFAQSMGDPNDAQIKRILLNVLFEFMTL